ncbi:CRM-domain containing factor CFM3, chloroplastic/mitochondrial isoform X1 [Canna indica]|uniref:CRM-domain containing factor CFM3, chloroplastic/mitochondrial isoform X1 n=1 Tax=Canna indica TaxID=4628 RepID=A0AAQ3K6K3_9LILI|nr:CRM-domain containing factor CFM3, chloroplastic/mitochondrial isoform X1 [Canna indica]
MFFFALLMAFALVPLNPRLPLYPSPPTHFLSSSSAFSVCILRNQRLLPSRSNLHVSHAYVSSEPLRYSNKEFPVEDPIEVEEKDNGINTNRKKTKKRKPRPSFNAQTLERWSAKISSQRSSFPWQDQKIQTSQDFAAPSTHVDQLVSEDEAPSVNLVNQIENVSQQRGRKRLDLIVEKLDGAADGKCSGPDFSDGFFKSSVDRVPPRANFVRDIPFAMRSISAPWAHGTEHGDNHLHSSYENKTLGKTSDFSAEDERHQEVTLIDEERGSNFDGPVSGSVIKGSPDISADANSQIHSAVDTSFRVYRLDSDPEVTSKSSMKSHESNINRKNSRVSVIVESLKDSICSPSSKVDKGVSFRNSESKRESNPELDVLKLASSVSFPWKREVDSEDGVQLNRSNTELAERTIPEPELRRLKDAALRMKQRMTVGPAGITEAVVESIHDNWKETEVVKLRFEGPPSLNMKRTHEILESKTGGLVIWRSGRSVVLYRGMTYELPCIQTYSKFADSDPSHNCNILTNNFSTDLTCNPALESLSISRRSEADTATHRTLFEESPDTSSIDSLLDQLGPRFKDWSGRNPLPVDADLLPSVIPGYTPPFRLLPYKTRISLRDKEMTALRRLARTVPPHFALGRNRQHQGLAAAIVKLWEKSSIAKIAIKRGIPNTHNERMAEEIKKLTGGVLLSRNKEYIVLYRGNDFVTPSIREVLLEKEKLATIHQDEEEVARLRASASVASVRIAKGPLVAGTLAETVEAKSRWGKPLSSKEREMVKKKMVLAQHASLVRYLERKLIFAKSKVRKAEKALAKVQEFLKPADLPTDLETVTDEERALFRNIGLKMKGAIVLGRREVFDGTVENMHMNWKHRELVKIHVKGKNFAQVKQIAISLEAESGGVLISLDKTTKGYAIVVYRGKNYQRPPTLKAKNLLTRRQALARSIELQRREALTHHISDLQQKIQMLKSQLEQMEDDKKLGKQDLNLQVDDPLLCDDDDDVEDEGEEAYLQTYSGDD